MPFGFLGTLASGIGKGVGFLGKGIKSGVNKLGELGQMDGDDGAASGGMFPQLKRPAPMTPGINPNAPMPDLIGTPYNPRGGKGGMFGKGMELINRQQPQPNAPPMLPRPSSIPTTGNPLKDIEAIERFQSQPSPSDVIGDMERLSNQVNANNREGRQGLLPMPEAQAQLIPERAIPKVAIPRLPGEERPDVDPRDNPVMAARYDYMRRQAKAPSTMREYSVNEDGSLGEAATREIPGTGGYRRSLKNVFQNALLGAAQGMQTTGDLGGALGGALTGGAGTAINPQAGYEFTFDNFYRPRIERDLAETQRNQDRQRKTAFEDEDRLQRKTDAEVKRREAEKRIENYDVDNRARQQEIKMRQDEMDYRRQNPPKQRRPTFRDEGGFMRYEDTGEYLLDPQTKQPIRGYDRPAAENDRPITVSPGATLYDPKTKTPLYTAPPRAAGMSREAQKAIQEVNGLKQQAMQLWEQAKQATDPTQKADLEQKARLAQYTFNEAALGLAEVYPDDFEAGEGEGGWNYAKPIGSTPQIQRRGQGAQGGTAKLSDLKKLLQ